MNKEVGERDREKRNVYLWALGVSIFVPSVLHPLYYLQERYAMRNLSNLPMLGVSRMLTVDGEGWRAMNRGFFS